METLMLSPDPLVAGGVVNNIFMISFRVLFFLSAMLLLVIVLLQEGKGGGLASALGGQGAETFGVATGGVNKVTLFLAGVFLVSALGHALTTQGVITEMKKSATQKPLGSGKVDDTKDLEEDKGDVKEPPVDPPKKETAPPKDAPPPKDALPPKDTKAQEPPKDAAPPKDQTPPK